MRLHTDARAAAATRAINARAFTLGADIAFAQGEYASNAASGRRLLAHELVHVVQQRGTGAARPDEPRLEGITAESSQASVVRRFTRAEAGDIANLDDVVDTAERVADDTGIAGLMRWGRFTAGVGGVGAWEALTPPESGSTGRLTDRYLFTCRCGLLDMRHFYQLMYIAVLKSNASATERGREHELAAEESSRFAAEDITSNALGAFFGSQRSWVQRQSTFVSALRTFLTRCDLVHFRTMPAADRNRVVDYYDARDASGAPLHREEAAVPAVLSVDACRGRDRTAPFTIVPTDPHQMTIEKMQ